MYSKDFLFPLQKSVCWVLNRILSLNHLNFYLDTACEHSPQELLCYVHIKYINL